MRDRRGRLLVLRFGLRPVAMARSGFPDRGGWWSEHHHCDACHNANRQFRQTFKRLPRRRPHHVDHRQRHTAGQFGARTRVCGPSRMQQAQTRRHVRNRWYHLRSPIWCHAIMADRCRRGRTDSIAKPAVARHRCHAAGVFCPDVTASRPRKDIGSGIDIGYSRTGLRAGRRGRRRSRLHICRADRGRIPQIGDSASYGGQRRSSGRGGSAGEERLLVFPCIASHHRGIGGAGVRHVIGVRVPV